MLIIVPEWKLYLLQHCPLLSSFCLLLHHPPLVLLLYYSICLLLKVPLLRYLFCILQILKKVLNSQDGGKGTSFTHLVHPDDKLRLAAVENFAEKVNKGLVRETHCSYRLYMSEIIGCQLFISTLVKKVLHFPVSKF